MLPIRYSRPSLSLFDNLFFEDLFDFPAFENSLTKCPIHDIIENDKEFIVEAMMAGVKKEDVSVDVDRDVLTITAERKEHKETKDLKYNRKESFAGKYQRSFILPDSVDAENINASLVDGVLKVTVPKLEKENKSSKKKIEIK